jgi:Protein of unknown function (DUF2628)
MAVYTVHEPPLKRYDSAPDPDRFVFVRDGFSFWAFVLGPVWMLRYRMWLVLVLYVALQVALQVALHRLAVAREVAVVVGLLLALLIGFEAGTLRRFTLGRRGFAAVGVIVGDDRELAEQRFFDAWVKDTPSGPWPSTVPPSTRAAAASDVIGLFPQPRAPR